MQGAAGEDVNTLRRKRKISVAIGLCLMAGGFTAALWGAAARGEYAEWYHGPVVWCLVVWIPGMFFFQDAMDLHAKVAAHLNGGSDRLRRLRDRMGTVGALALFMWGFEALTHGSTPMGLVKLTVGSIVLFVSANLLIGARVLDRQLIVQLQERDPEPAGRV